jgi:hypothetical protein
MSNTFRGNRHDVREYTKADLTARKSNFRFTPESGLRADIAPCLFRAKNGSRPYSIISSARARSAGGLRDQLQRKPWRARTRSLADAVKKLSLLCAETPDDRARPHLEKFINSIEPASLKWSAPAGHRSFLMRFAAR